jgi:hypothetical protein
MKEVLSHFIYYWLRGHFKSSHNISGQIYFCIVVDWLKDTTFNFNEILICKCQKKYICCLNIMWIQSNLPKRAPVYNKSVYREQSHFSHQWIVHII